MTVFVGEIGEAAPEELQAVSNMLRRIIGNLFKVVSGIWLFLGKFYRCLPG